MSPLFQFPFEARSPALEVYVLLCSHQGRAGPAPRSAFATTATSSSTRRPSVRRKVQSARREIQIVGCDHGGDLSLAHEPQQLFEHLVGGVRIQIAGRFVREQNLGLVRDSAGNGDTLLLAGQLGRAMVPARSSRPSGSEKLFGSRPRVALSPAKHKLRKHHVLQGGKFRQEVMELIDEAHFHAADASPLAVAAEPQKPRPLMTMLSLASGFSRRPAICRRVDLPAPEGPSSDRLARIGKVAEAFVRTSIRRSPCTKARSRSPAGT